jgi:uncharacterized protein YuzE
MISQSYDLDADALYVELADRQVARTVPVDSGTLVDLDADGEVVGIEVIQPQRTWPLREILKRFPLPAGTVAELCAYFQAPAQLRAPEHPDPRVPVAVSPAA